MTSEKKNRKVYVVGHKNPDTDSICSALAYANLKRKVTGQEYVAKRAGQVNEETQYFRQIWSRRTGTSVERADSS